MCMYIYIMRFVSFFDVIEIVYYKMRFILCFVLTEVATVKSAMRNLTSEGRTRDEENKTIKYHVNKLKSQILELETSLLRLQTDDCKLVKRTTSRKSHNTPN